MVYQTSPEKSCFTRFISLLLVIGFIPTSILAILMFNGNTVLLNRDTYKNVLSHQDIYNKIPALAAEQITYVAADCADATCQMNRSANLAYAMQIPPAYLANLGQAEWETIFSILMPADLLQAQAEGFIDQVFDGLDSNDQPVTASISLESMRSRLTDDSYQQISSVIMDKAPVCTANELVVMGAIMFGASADNLPFCTPTEEFRPLLETAINATVRYRVQTLPAEITFNSDTLLAPSPETSQPGNGLSINPVQKIKWMRTGFMISPLVPLFLLILIGVFAVRSWGDAGKWLGLPLVISGVIALLISALVLFSSPWMVTNILLSSLSSQICPGCNQAIRNVVQSVALRYVFWNGLAAGVMFLGGGVLFLISKVIKPRQD